MSLIGRQRYDRPDRFPAAHGHLQSIAGDRFRGTCLAMKFAQKIVLNCPVGYSNDIKPLVERFLADGVKFVGVVGVDCGWVTLAEQVFEYPHEFLYRESDERASSITFESISVLFRWSWNNVVDMAR